MKQEEEAKKLTVAVGQLAKNVHALDVTLKKEYPKRREIERNFVTKVEGRKRLVTAAVTTVGAIIFSFFATVGTVNYCFLAGIPEPGAKPACRVFSNWDESFENNRRFLERYNQLEKEIASNRGRLNELEGK